MNEESNKSGTYIEFSFEKSLRRYQNPSCKRARQNPFANNQHVSSCQHCMSKFYRRDSIQSQDRKVKIQSSRKNQLIKSRCKARQFSQTKKRKQQSNSANKSRQSSIKRQSQNSWKKNQVSIILSDPLSEFNIGEQLNLRHLKREEILNLSLNKDVPRFQYHGMSGTKKVKQNQIENELTIEKILQRNNLKECTMFQRQNNLSIKKRIDLFGLCSIQDHSKIIEEQDESFSQLSLTQSNLVMCTQLLVNQEKQIEQENKISCVQQEIEYKISQNPAISYAYFSSCYSVQSFQSQQIQINQIEYSGKINQNQNQKDQQAPEQEPNPFQNLRLQSKEELKKQCRNQQRQRVFYKIKRISQVDKVYSQCQNISEDIKNQLKKEMKSQKILNQQPKQTPITLPSQNEEPMKAQPQNIEEMKLQHSVQKTKQEEIHKNQNPFKRFSPCQLQQNDLETNIYKKKSRKLNFEIDQDYQRLGRVRIQGPGQENQSICLSVRRLSKQAQSLSKQLGPIGSLDENKVVKYLISQRPYLEKNKTQLQKLLSMIMGLSRKSNQQIGQKDIN